MSNARFGRHVMLERRGDVFDSIGHLDAFCITTNGYVNKKLANIMGAGNARQAKVMWPDIEYHLGKKIMQGGNNVHPLISDKRTICYSFPVKPSYLIYTSPRQKMSRARIKDIEIGDILPGWACYADIDIIIRSAIQLVEFADSKRHKTIAIPRPGCGAGGLLWRDVKPSLDHILDDRFCIVTK